MLAVESLSEEFETVIVAAPDVQGRLFGRRMPVRRFLADPDQSIDICTCALAWDIAEELDVETPFAGFHTGWNDFSLKADLSTLRRYPGSSATAICLADISDDHGKPLRIAPRAILREQAHRAEQLGFRSRFASELEFYLFRQDMRTARLSRFQNLEPTTLVRSDYSIVGQAVQEPFMRRLRRKMDAAEISIYACQGEYGLGQWEVNLDHEDALEMADRHVIYKAGVKELALRRGLTVTFMARPVPSDMGSSCHFHCSLWQGDKAAFPTEQGGHEIGPVGRHFIGGLLTHLDETALFFAPYVNSYKRHLTKDFGGGIKAWGIDNRTVSIRVVGRGNSLHVEHRYAGADANPYLAMAAILASGLDGIEGKVDPGEPLQGNAYERTDLAHTPLSLDAATRAFECSEFNRETFGDEVVKHYAAHGNGEWNAYLRAVTDWELIRCFEIV